jgi:DNA-binding response OmpR family regulator
MPGSTGVEVCREARKQESTRGLYIILLTANQEKEKVVEGLEAGANDYIVKPFSSEELRARVGVGVRVLELQFDLARKYQELQSAMDHIRSLQGILPICMHCHKIRTDNDAWDRMEKYIEDHSEAQFSHSICPQCMEKHHPDPED